jgi:transposase
MELYVGMDVSLKETSICVVDGKGEIVSEGTVISEPSAIAAFIKAKAGNAVRVGLETGPTTTWLWHELRALGLPVICIDARHAKAALSLQINKSDRNDAAGLARIMQCGWYKEVQVKSVSCHEIRAVLNRPRPVGQDQARSREPDPRLAQEPRFRHRQGGRHRLPPPGRGAAGPT